MKTKKPAGGPPKSSPSPVTVARYELAGVSDPVVAEADASTADKKHRVISATEAARRFSDLINKVGYKGEVYIIERGGKPMCELSPVDVTRFTGDDFRALLASLPKPDAKFLDVVEELAREQPGLEGSPWDK